MKLAKHPCVRCGAALVLAITLNGTIVERLQCGSCGAPHFANTYLVPDSPTSPDHPDREPSPFVRAPVVSQVTTTAMASSGLSFPTTSTS